MFFFVFVFGTYTDGICMHIQWFSEFPGMDCRQMILVRLKICNVFSSDRLRWRFAATNTMEWRRKMKRLLNERKFIKKEFTRKWKIEQKNRPHNHRMCFITHHRFLFSILYFTKLQTELKLELWNWFSMHTAEIVIKFCIKSVCSK